MPIIKKAKIKNTNGEIQDCELGAIDKNIEVTIENSDYKASNLKETLDKITKKITDTSTTVSNIAPKEHAATDGTYGLGNSLNYGHVKVSENFIENESEENPASVTVSQKALRESLSSLNASLASTEKDVYKLDKIIEGFAQSKGSKNFGPKTVSNVTAEILFSKRMGFTSAYLLISVNKDITVTSSAGGFKVSLFSSWADSFSSYAYDGSFGAEEGKTGAKRLYFGNILHTLNGVPVQLNIHTISAGGMDLIFKQSAKAGDKLYFCITYPSDFTITTDAAKI